LKVVYALAAATAEQFSSLALRTQVFELLSLLCVDGMFPLVRKPQLKDIFG
jgi:hypothetical protein